MADTPPGEHPSPSTRSTSAGDGGPLPAGWRPHEPGPPAAPSAHPGWPGVVDHRWPGAHQGWPDGAHQGWPDGAHQGWPGGGPPPPATPPVVRRSGLRRALVMAAVIVFIAACAIYMLYELGGGLGLQALIVGLIAAILPVPVLVACFLWLDRYEPEPMKYLIFCFAWGAFVSTAASLNVNREAAEAFQAQGLPDALVAVLVAPFIEELTKSLGPILLLFFRRRQWSGITDGIVYCGLSAIGFAMVENILYLGGYGYAAGAEQYGPATGAQNVFAIFIVRILFTGFAHPLFTSMTGVGLGIAARSADRRVRVAAVLAGLLLAMMLHGAWNFMPSLAVATGQNLILLYGYIGVMVPIFLGMVGFAIWLRGWEGRVVERTLPDYVHTGWLTPPEVAALGSLGRRHSARRWARRVAGERGHRAMRDFQFAATRLALLRDGMRRGLDTAPRDLARTRDEERNLLDAISACRSVFVGRDPHAPVGVWDGRRYHLTFPDGVRRPVEAPQEPVVPVPVLLTPGGAPGGPMGGAPGGPMGGPTAGPMGGPGGHPGGPGGGFGGAPGGPMGGPGGHPYGPAGPFGTPGGYR